MDTLTLEATFSTQAAAENIAAILTAEGHTVDVTQYDLDEWLVRWSK